MFAYTVVLNAIKLYDTYKNYKKTALELSKTQKISRQTIMNWYKKYPEFISS